jgi:hypothetical protein
MNIIPSNAKLDPEQGCQLAGADIGPGNVLGEEYAIDRKLIHFFIAIKGSEIEQAIIMTRHYSDNDFCAQGWRTRAWGSRHV